ncbi:ciliary microtubule inner protein 2A [Chamaea fasciata]|uniref:ciliary microtubule inner protein 2A n=1 Tax=Chamaea fasciata TaxID=190680 RepID=UPI00336A6F97
MAGFKGHCTLPQTPYHIPGYGGYIPQLTFRFGDTYGRTTHKLLLDPTISKSPRSLLAPLDNKENLLELRYQIDHPGYVTYQPIESPPEIPLGPQPVPAPVPKEPMMTPLEPRQWQGAPGTAVSGAQQSWMAPEQRWGLALHPAAEEMEREVAKPPLAGVLGRLIGTGQCNCGERAQCKCAGSKMQLETGGVTLPGGATADYPLPVLPVPNAIQQKVVTGYAGFVPCITDTVGMTFIPSVNKAMKEFDQHQLLERNPPYTLGTRFPLTHWPDTKIYSRAGLISTYAGHVPHLQDICGLTYRDGTLESHRCEQRRRGRAL